MTGKVLTIAQQKGGSGKTTLAANLAVAFRQSGKSVAVLDTDPQGSLGRWFMMRDEHAGENGADIGFATASAWGARYESRKLKGNHDLVIIDTPPKMDIDGRPAIEAADLVIIPVTPSQVDLWATEPTLEMAKGEKTPVLVVLNRAAPRTRLSGEISAELKKTGSRVAETSIGNRILFAEAMGTGSSVVEKRRTSPAAAEIGGLAQEVEEALQAL